MANHIATLVPPNDLDSSKAAKAWELFKLAVPDDWKSLSENCNMIDAHADLEYCGKWKVLSEFLGIWHSNGVKVLVFSHSVRLLEILKRLSVLCAFNVTYLTGKMSYENRTKAVNDFNSDPSQFVFFISSGAGAPA